MTGSCLSLPQSELLIGFSRFISWFGDGIMVPVLLVTATALFFLVIKRDKYFALILALSTLSGQVLKSLLKNLFRVPRPEALGCQVLTEYGDRFSFPSGHTIFYTVFFGLLIWYGLKQLPRGWRRNLLLFVSVTMLILIGFSRVYLRAHWPLDVVAGYFVGGVILTASILLYNHLSKAKVKR